MKVMLVINDNIIHNMDVNSDDPNEVIQAIDGFLMQPMDYGHQDDAPNTDEIEIVIGPEMDDACETCGCSGMQESKNKKLKVGDKVNDNKSEMQGTVTIVGLDDNADSYVIDFGGAHASRSIDEITPITENTIEIEVDDDNEFSIDNNSGSEVEVKVKDGDVDIEVSDIEDESEDKSEDPEELMDFVDISIIKLDDGNTIKAIHGDSNILYVDSWEASDSDIEFEFRGMIYKFPVHIDEDNSHIDLDVNIKDESLNLGFLIQNKIDEDYDAMVNIK